MAKGVKMKPTSVIVAHLGLEPNGRVQKFFTNTCYKYMNEYVPKKEGILRGTVFIDANSITYEVPYARYMYYGKKMVMKNGKSAYYNPDYGFWSKKGEKKTVTNEDLVYHKPGTGAYWDKKMWSVEKDNVLAEVQAYVNRGG